MTTDIVPADPKPGRTMLVPATLQQGWIMAGDLARTAAVPKGLRNDQAGVFAVVVWASEVGVGVIQALNGVHVIEGSVSVKPEMMRSLVRRAGHQLEIRTMSEERCVVWGKRADTGEELESTYTMEDARRAGVTGKDVWKKYPRAMLLARASGELGRALFSDVIAGLGYTPEEVAEVHHAEMTPEQVQANIAHDDYDDPPARPPDTPAPEGDGVEDAEVVGEAPAQAMTQVTNRRLFAVLAKADLSDDEARHKVASLVTGRTVESFTSLSEDEARSIIAHLEEAIRQHAQEQHPSSDGPDAERGRLKAVIDGGGKARFIAWCRANKVGSKVDDLEAELVTQALAFLEGGGDD